MKFCLSIGMLLLALINMSQGQSPPQYSNPPHGNADFVLS